MRLAVAMLVSAIDLVSAIAFACDCLTPVDPEQRFELATVVFSGRVLATEILFTPEWRKTDRFEVIEHFKGQKHASYVVEHDGANCSFDFTHGASYLVFAYRRQALEANICSGN